MQPTTSKHHDKFIASLQDAKNISGFMPRVLHKQKTDLHEAGAFDCSLSFSVCKGTVFFELDLLYKHIEAEKSEYNYTMPYSYLLRGRVGYGGNITFDVIDIHTSGCTTKAEHQVYRISHIDRPVTSQQLLQQIDYKLNHDYNNLSKEEQALLLLSGKFPVGSELTRQLSEIITELQKIGDMYKKRSRYVRVASILSGRWFRNDNKQTGVEAVLNAIGPIIIASAYGTILGSLVKVVL